MKDFFRQKAPFLIFFPILLIELVVFTRTVGDFTQKRPLFSESPDSQVALETTQARVLGAAANSQLAIFLDWAVVLLIVISAVFLFLLWRKSESDILER